MFNVVLKLKVLLPWCLLVIMII